MPYKDKEKMKEARKKWKDNNRETARACDRRCYRRNALRNKLNKNVSSYIRTSLSRGKQGKHWEELVGYTLKELREHLEKQFTPEMNWNNYGSYWEIDHITPKSWYKIKSYNDRQFKLCWSLKNLRPLEKIKNTRKQNKLILE